MNNKFDPTKPLQTRDGREVVIFDYQLEGLYPIVGKIRTKTGWECESWKSNGASWKSNEERPEDLINIPEPKKWRAWKQEEVPAPGFLYRTTQNRQNVYVVIACSDAEKGTCRYAMMDSFRDVVNWYSLSIFAGEYSTDHGKTWQPCGVLE